MAAEGFEMVRYAVDFVVLCRTSPRPQTALAMITEWVEQAALLLAADEDEDSRQPHEKLCFLVTRFTGTRSLPIAKVCEDGGLDRAALTLRKRPGSIASIAKELDRVLSRFGSVTFDTVAGQFIKTWTSRFEPSAAAAAETSQEEPKVFNTSITLALLSTLRRWVCTVCEQTTFVSLNPGATSDWIAVAGEPHVRFGGRGVRLNRTSLPLSSIQV